MAPGHLGRGCGRLSGKQPSLHEQGHPMLTGYCTLKTQILLQTFIACLGTPFCTTTMPRNSHASSPCSTDLRKLDAVRAEMLPERTPDDVREGISPDDFPSLPSAPLLSAPLPSTPLSFAALLDAVNEASQCNGICHSFCYDVVVAGWVSV